MTEHDLRDAPRTHARRTQLLIDQAVEPHAATIAEIHARGEIAVVVHKPVRRVAVGARMLGWNGEVGAFGIAQRVARDWLAHVDDVTARWVERQDLDGAKVFLVTGRGSVLLNVTAGNHYTSEPESLDEMLAASPNPVPIPRGPRGRRRASGRTIPFAEVQQRARRKAGR